MRIGVASSSPGGLSAYVTPLEMAQVFTIIDLEDHNIKGTYTVTMFPSMFGPSMPSIQKILNEGVEAVIASSYSPSSLMILQQNGVKAFITPPNITVKQAVDQYLSGRLQEASSIGTFQPMFGPPQPPLPMQAPTQTPSYPTSPQLQPFPQQPPPEYQYSMPPIQPPTSKEEFIEMLKKQLWMLEQQKWMLEENLKSLQKALKDIEERIESIKRKLKELET